MDQNERERVRGGIGLDTAREREKAKGKVKERLMNRRIGKKDGELRKRIG